MVTINPYINFNGNAEEADRLFDGLSEGGAFEIPMAESPWGTYFAMFRDKYGIEWTVEFDQNM